MTTVTLTGYPHVWCHIPDQAIAWPAFAAAAAGGGSPPRWTEAEDPRYAHPPADAAGTLWRLGDTAEVPETIARAAEWLSQDVLADAAVTPLAAYFSSGGRGVFLLGCGVATYVTICRGDEPKPRLGSSGENLNYLLGGDHCVLWSRR